jgi:hypothetical protein
MQCHLITFEKREKRNPVLGGVTEDLFPVTLYNAYPAGL